MKTYKQRNLELHNKLRILQEQHNKVGEENSLRKQVIEDNKLFDPIEYQRIWKKLSIAVDGLEVIKMLSFVIENQDRQNEVHRVTQEVLAQIGNPFLKVE